LVAYGKEHIEEVAEFIYDMFENNIEVGWPQMSLYDECLGKPLVSTEDGGYINPAWEPVQNMYKVICGLHCGRIKGGKVLLDDAVDAIETLNNN